MPNEVDTFQKLEAHLPEAAQNIGIDTSKPFPFLIAGEASFLQWFVVDGMGNQLPNPQSSFLRARYLGGLNDVKIEGLGFYSTKHQGIFTTPNNNMHIHFCISRNTLNQGLLASSIRLLTSSSLKTK